MPTISPTPKLKTYNPKLNWLLLIPPAVVLTLLLPVFNFVYWGDAALGRPRVYAVLVTATIVAAILYWKQAVFMRQAFPGKVLKKQLVTVAVALFLPVIGACVGDVSGIVAFSDYSNGISLNFAIGGALGGIVAYLFTYIILLYNSLYIAKSGLGTGAEAVVKVFRVIGYLIVAATAWYAYQMSYTLHDPSIE